MRKKAEPLAVIPSPADLLVIGKNSRGAWVVGDQSGLRSGLFVDRAEALRFALFESGRRPQAVVMPGSRWPSITPARRFGFSAQAE
jgi:hypothetical protein